MGTGTLKVTGGEITGGTAATMAPGIYAYYNKSNVEVTGGHIDALTYTDAETFKISGNPVINLLEIESGKAFELGDLTAGADITVAATGIFSTANANAQSYVDAGYVKLADTWWWMLTDSAFTPCPWAPRSHPAHIVMRLRSPGISSLGNWPPVTTTWQTTSPRKLPTALSLRRVRK